MDKIIKLQCFADFTDSTNLKNFFIKTWFYGKTYFKNIEVVDDGSYTHALLINMPRIPLNIPKENVIGFMHEPNILLNWNSYTDYIKQNIGTFICHDKNFFPDWECFKEGLCYLAPGLPLYNDDINLYNPQKQYRMNIIASEKQFLPGHRLRHEIIRRILRTNLDIHVCGRGSFIYNDPRVKGPVDNKENAFFPYEFSIAIENDKLPCWVTEKYYDPILANTIPLYWGATKINQFFDARSHIELPDSIDTMMDIIIDVYKNGCYNKSSIYAKQQLYNETNLAYYLWKHFNG